jgi:hypothetical protein
MLGIYSVLFSVSQWTVSTPDFCWSGTRGTVPLRFLDDSRSCIRCWALFMSRTYTITVTPQLLKEGEHKGHLEYLHFSATVGSNTHKWWCVHRHPGDDLRAIFGDWDQESLSVFARARR